MVNYYANSTEVLGDNYSIISLECDEYNPNIDGTVTLTVTAKSVYGNPIEDMEIPVTCSDGNFTELNGSSITGASTVTGTTDSNGEFTLTYSCSEWGLITFSANNSVIQIRVVGCKATTVNQYYTIYEYEDKVGLRIGINTNITFKTTWSLIYNQAIPWNLRPRYPVTCPNFDSGSSTSNTALCVRQANTGETVEILGKSLGSQVSTTAYAYLEWSKV